MNSVNMLAEFVEVEAAHIEMPISHHGMERPERKKSPAFLPARREHAAAMPTRTAKKAATAAQSHAFISIFPLISIPFYATRLSASRDSVRATDNFLMSVL
jgi:hypothetical protein